MLPRVKIEYTFGLEEEIRRSGMSEGWSGGWWRRIGTLTYYAIVSEARYGPMVGFGIGGVGGMELVA
jgi:hypothetical protein